MNKILHMGGVSVLTCLQFFDSLFKATEELISDKKAFPPQITLGWMKGGVYTKTTIFGF